MIPKGFTLALKPEVPESERHHETVLTLLQIATVIVC